MKVIARPIDMISWTDSTGSINPIKYRIANKRGVISEYKVDKVTKVDERWIAGCATRIFYCESLVKGEMRICEIRYNTKTCQWIMFKI